MKHIFELPENKFKTVKINFSRAVIDGKIKAVLETKSGKILAEFPTGLGVMRCIFADRKGNSIVCSDYSKVTACRSLLSTVSSRLTDMTNTMTTGALHMLSDQ